MMGQGGFKLSLRANTATAVREMKMMTTVAVGVAAHWQVAQMLATVIVAPP